MARVKELPKINERFHQSNIMQQGLRSELWKLVERFQKENNYKFEMCEIDNVLLGLVKRSHEEYIVEKFGNEVK